MIVGTLRSRLLRAARARSSLSLGGAVFRRVLALFGTFLCFGSSAPLFPRPLSSAGFLNPYAICCSPHRLLNVSETSRMSDQTGLSSSQLLSKALLIRVISKSRSTRADTGALDDPLSRSSITTQSFIVDMTIESVSSCWPTANDTLMPNECDPRSD